MKISTSYKLFAVFSTVLLLIIGTLAFQALNIQKDLVRSEQHRFQSYRLAIELFQSSEDLTRMARSYVSTGNLTYKKRYLEILDIRNGKLPRPTHYSVTYWHLAGAGRGPVVAPGETVALQDLMQREGFTEQEFALLRESQFNSDNLVKMEEQAFHAINGLYEDSLGDFTIRRAPDRNYAVNLLFSERYFNEKARIMAPIQQFMDVLDKRTKTELVAHESKLYRYIMLTLFFIIIALFGVILKIIHSFRRILHPVECLCKQVAEIKSGNFTARCHSVSENEIGELCAHFNSMAGFLETDILKRKEVEETLKQNEERVRLLLNSTAEAIYGIDLQGNCTFANPSCLGMLGYTDMGQLLGKNMHRLIHHSYPDGQPMAVEDCRIYKAFRIGKGEHVDTEVLWRADGTSFHAEYWSFPQLVNGKVSGAVVTFNDITERRLSEEKIRHMATHDGLTDLPTLQLLKDRLSMAVNSAHRYKTMAAVMFVDLDGFKTVNDTYGHDAGDDVLKEVAKRLCAGVRETDTVARAGGDEFVLVVTELQSPENAAKVAEKVVKIMAHPFIVKNRQISVGASIGIALFPRDGDNIDRLIKLADEAMYKIKNSGKNGFVFASTAQ
jgi:diguanylate cyclase (GGDEF)-like protein/PAS domain S-box-containing protein